MSKRKSPRNNPQLSLENPCLQLSSGRERSGEVLDKRKRLSSHDESWTPNKRRREDDIFFFVVEKFSQRNEMEQCCYTFINGFLIPFISNFGCLSQYILLIHLRVGVILLKNWILFLWSIVVPSVGSLSNLINGINILIHFHIDLTWKFIVSRK